MTNKYIHFNQMLDQLLLEMEVVDIRNMVMVLAGALDSALSIGCDPASLRRTLLSHPMGAVIAAGSHHLGIPEQISSTRKRLSVAVEQLSFARALRARTQLTCDAIGQSLKYDGRICLLDDTGEAELARLSEAGGRNIIRAYGQKCGGLCIDTAFGALDKSYASGLRFDQILATRIADNLPEDALRNLVLQAGQNLTTNGSMLMSCFVPEHIGLGWRTVCHGEEIYCHDETVLSKIAAESGLAISQFRDASGCLIWAELKRCENQPSKWGQ